MMADREAAKFAYTPNSDGRHINSGVDDWLTVDNETDVNLWSDMYGAIHATAYPVVNTQTQTDRGVQLF